MEKRKLIYPDAAAFRASPAKRIAFIGMSGLGKTYISNMLRDSGGWFHYSVDYRIGTRYMDEHIVDDFKLHAMKTPFLAELLMSDSIYIGSNITFNNLAPLSAFLGKPGSDAHGGIAFEEYMRRQSLHKDAEISATLDVVSFLRRAGKIYGYPHFVCDTSGSICEVVDPSDRDDPVLSAMSDNLLIIWLKGSDADVETLCERFSKAPKPMYSRPERMQARWERYGAETGKAEQDIDPDDFIRWSYRGILEERLPIYKAIADGWGITIPAKHLARAKRADDVIDVIASALPD